MPCSKAFLGGPFFQNCTLGAGACECTQFKHAKRTDMRGRHGLSVKHMGCCGAMLNHDNQLGMPLVQCVLLFAMAAARIRTHQHHARTCELDENGTKDDSRSQQTALCLLRATASRPVCQMSRVQGRTPKHSQEKQLPFKCNTISCGQG